MRPIIMVALVTTMVFISASSAAAADKTVGFNRADYIYLPERVAIKTGESVTWSNAGSDEPHNVHFEDGQFIRPVTPATSFTTSPRTFSADGVYRYFCDTHGRDMSGSVYVNATGVLPPDARLRVSPNPAVAGQVVMFDGTATKAGDNPVARYEWDLNGDGMYEVNTGATRTTSQTYLSAQELTARLKVTDSSGAFEVREMPVTIEAAPPADPPPSPSPAPAPQPTAPAPQPQPQPARQVTTSTGTAQVAPPPGTFSFRATATASRVKGAAVKVTCSGRCRITATLSVSASVARKARLGRKAMTIGSVRATRSSAGTKTVRVRLTRKARLRLARLKSVRATLKLAVSDASGVTTRKQRSITLKR